MSFVHATRGGLLESRHRVHAAVVRPDGALVAWAGDPEFLTFMRSSAKPFQALPLVGAMAGYGLEPGHLAVACASHAGEPVHVETVREMQERAGVRPEELVCGTHPPFDPQTRADMAARGEKPGVLHHNCSGKHTGMIIASRAHGWDAAGYERPDHPLQREITGLLIGLAGLERVQSATDGCSVPAYAMPLRNAALAFARLAEPDTAPPELRGPLETVFGALTGHPYLVAGRDRLDTRLMEALPGAVSKVGAEAYHGMALRETRFGPLGLALKIEDGGERARDAAVVRVLAGLGLADEEAPPFTALARSVLTNHAGLTVGEVRAEFELERT